MGSLGEFLSAQRAGPVVPAATAGYPPQDDRQGEGLWGLLGNFGADVSDVLGGLYRLLGTGVSEAITQPTNVAKELFTLGFADTPVNVLTPALIPHMGQAIVEDVKDRYFEGDIGQELYDHPLSFLLDVTAVAGAAGAGARAASGVGLAGKVGRSVLGAERVARNAGLLDQARLLRSAKVSEDAAMVAKITKDLGSDVRKARILDNLVVTPTSVADPMSGFTFDILPTKNPIINAVWSEPVRRKYFLEGVDTFRSKVDEARAIVDNGGSTEDVRRLMAMESALSRMEASGAQYVAGKQYGTVIARAKIKRGTDELLGKLNMRGIVDRREQREALRAIIRNAGVTPEVLSTFHRQLEGLDDGLPLSMSPEVLNAQIVEKGFNSMEEAADELLRKGPRSQLLDADERTSLTGMVIRGEIDPLRPFRDQAEAIIGRNTGASEDNMPIADAETGEVMSVKASTDRRIERLDSLFQQAQGQELESFTDLGEGTVKYQRPGADRAIYLAVDDVTEEVPVVRAAEEAPIGEWHQTTDKRTTGTNTEYEEPGFFANAFPRTDGTFGWSSYRGARDGDLELVDSGDARTVEEAQAAAKGAIDRVRGGAAPPKKISGPSRPLIVTRKANELLDKYEAAADAQRAMRAGAEARHGKVDYATATERKKFDAKIKATGKAFDRLVKYLEDNMAPPEGHSTWKDVKPTEIKAAIRAVAPEDAGVPPKPAGLEDVPDEVWRRAATDPDVARDVDKWGADFADIDKALRHHRNSGTKEPFNEWEWPRRLRWNQRKLLAGKKPKPAAPAAAVKSVSPPETETVTTRHVVGYRDTKGTDGNVLHTASRSDMRRRGIGERLHRAHWTDQGINTPDRILAALESNTFTPEAAELNRKMAREFAEKTQAAYHDVAGTLTEGPRRRTRVIEEVTPINRPDGREVKQGVVGADNLRRMAVEAAGPIGTALRGVFGAKNVKLRLKEAAKIAEAQKEGVRILDALGARVMVDNWRGIERAVDAIESSGLEVLGVDDLRRVPGTGGMRGVKVYVRAPESRLVSEIEVGTPLFDRFREATASHDRKLSRLHRDLRREEGVLARISSSDNANQAGVAQAAEQQARLVEALQADVSAGDRYLEGYYEMLADEIALHHGKALSGMETRGLMNDIRLWNARFNEAPLIDNGFFDFVYAFERAYLPARLRSGAEWVGDDFHGGDSAYAIDDARAAAGLPMPVYFPHIEVPGNLTDWITPKSGQGQRKLSENKNLRRNRGKLFEEGTYITDIEDAYSRRAARAIKMRDTYEMIAEVSKRFGRAIESVDDLMPGEKVLAPQFLQAYIKIIIGVEDRMGAVLSKMSEEDLMGNVADLSARLGHDNVADIITEGIRGALGIGEKEAGALYLAVAEAIPQAQRELLAVTKRGLELYAMPKVVVDRLGEAARWNLGPGVRVFWDKPTQLWRALTLYGRPAWVVNNILGNITFSKIGGVRLREVLRTALDKDYRFYVDELARSGDGVEQGWFSSLDTYSQNLGVAEDTLSGRAVMALEARGRSSRMLKPFRVWADAIKKLNTNVENAFRRVGYVEGLRKADVLRDTHRVARGFWGSKEELQKMLADGITPERADRAMDLMQSWFGDYSTMSPFERQVVRRFIAPFWGFYRHMGKMVVKMPFDYPEKMAVIRTLALVDRDIREEYGSVPEWMDGMVPFGPMSPDGQQRFLSTAGPNPFNAFMDIGLGLFHPAIKATIEMMTGRDAYTGREFSDPDVFTPFGSTQRYQIVRGEGGVPVDAVPIDKVTPSLPVELLSQIPQYDWLRSALAGGRTYDTVGLMGAAREGPITDSEGNPIAPFSGSDVLARSLGAGFFDYDIAGFRERQAKERENALTMAYERWAEQQVGSPVGVG